MSLGLTTNTLACMHAKLLQLYPALGDPKDSSPAGFSVYRILQSRTLEWVAILLQGIFPTQGLNPHLLSLLHVRQVLYHKHHLGSLQQILLVKLKFFLSFSLLSFLLLLAFFLSFSKQLLSAYMYLFYRESGIER